ncbi:alpha-ketoglutarate-dependent dioxygenase AlkB [uncultured Tenacibaculum sp.]|uniref:alpha-ketoglutarate-dependent dioxygenase AlkB n=1 Tax=uncultured Tenacibaculum sp. TaxID=174713 RepID=UPI00261E3DEE|nr:alpha-ketoglutarate-dependent dioxygenase AlkB [uncultured Tenacibaculum sp.]
MNQENFIKVNLEFDSNLFSELSSQINFENVGKGRLANHLVKSNDEAIPIVRTTTQYSIPAHHFSSTHDKIIENINNSISDFGPISFNNALIEIYDNSYKKMKYHSDQALDLAPNSYIALYSCYENPEELTAQAIRKLKVKNKTSEEEFEISLTHNSLVLFSLTTNSKFYHKIVLEQVPKQKPLTSENKWLGITFRKSKTFIKFKNDLAYFENNKLLELANDAQKKEYFMLRGKENRSLNFNYPELNYTLSKADLILPKMVK